MPPNTLGSIDDTIAAIASAPGGAARGIVRIAGAGAVAIVARCFAADSGASPADVRSQTRLTGSIELMDLGGRRVPCDLYLWPTERSYCRMPMAEIHTIGSPPLLAAVLRAVCTAGARAAEPGEFTLRAFLGGRLDLPQAEAVLGVIDARGERDFQTALSQLSGGLSTPLNHLRNTLLETLAHLEAGLDFVEEDIEFISATALDASLTEALAQVESLAAQMTSRLDTTQALQVVLTGRPNAGKSSLFNALVGRSRAAVAPALVSPQPGTTRDYLVARLTLDGITCDVVDTAGLDDRSDLGTPDALAQAATAQLLSRADVEIRCLDATSPPTPSDFACRPSRTAILVLTKCDLDRRMGAARFAPQLAAIETSAVTGLGLEALEQAIAEMAARAEPQDAHVVAATAQRCRASLAAAANSLRKAQQLLAAGGVEELLAAEIRAALTELGHVTGAVYTDDILDRVFSRFCIGK